MEINNPRRILALGPSESGVLDLIHDLTGSAPVANDESVAGLSHVWDVKTAYYTVKIPIWIDEIVQLEEWKTEFLKPEAKEVVSVLGAWIYCFKKPISASELESVKKALKAVSEVIAKGSGSAWDGICLAVAMPQRTTPHLHQTLDDWEDICRECGFEYVDAEARGRNEYGEPVGIPRIREALESNDWAGDEEVDLSDLDPSEHGDDDEPFGTFAFEEAEMGTELLGLKNAVNNLEDTEASLPETDEGARQVEELEFMMRKMQSIKDMGADMDPTARRKFAARAVNDLLKTR